MKNALLLCSILLLVVSTGAFAADPCELIIEDFNSTYTEDSTYIDKGGASPNETPQQMLGPDATGFTWGGMVEPNDGEIFNQKGSKIQVKNSDPNAYFYTIFDGSGGSTADRTVDLVAGKISTQMDINKDAGDTNDVTIRFRFMVRNGAGNWYISDSNLAVESSDKTWFELDTSYGAETWTEVTNTTSLDALAGNDEVQLTSGSSGLSPWLDSVDGVGVYITSKVNIHSVNKLTCYEIRAQDEAWGTGDKATEPSPYDGCRLNSSLAGGQVKLQWTPGKGAVGHRVYFGTNPAALPELTTPGDPCTHAYYDVSGLEAPQKYYWAVDEVNGLDGETLGDTWLIDYNSPATSIKEDFTRWGLDANSEAMFVEDAHAFVQTSGYTGFPWSGYLPEGLEDSFGVEQDNTETPDVNGLIYGGTANSMGTYYYTIFSAYGDKTEPTDSVSKLESVSILTGDPEADYGQATDDTDAVQIMIRDAAGDWYLSNDITNVGNDYPSTEPTVIDTTGFTWREITGDAAVALNAIDPNTDEVPDPHPAKDIREYLDSDSTFPDISEITGGGIMLYVEHVGKNADVNVITWDGNSIPMKAWNPQPADSGQIGDPFVTLRWQPGAGAVGHRVYFGTQSGNLSELTTGDPCTHNYYAVSGLDYEEEYFWRIDEVNASDVETTGDEWSFDSPPTSIFEDFINPAQQVENQLYLNKKTEETIYRSYSAGFSWGGWGEPGYGHKAKVWLGGFKIDQENPDERDKVFFQMGNAGDSQYIYSIFSTTGTNVSDISVPNLNTVKLLQNTSQDIRLIIRDANDDWYLSSTRYFVTADVNEIIDISAWTWEMITDPTASEMDELDTDSSTGYNILADLVNTTAHLDPSQTRPDLTKITGAGYMECSSTAKPKLEYMEWIGYETPWYTAYMPYPGNGAVDITPFTNVYWEAGYGVSNMSVYFGDTTDPCLVEASDDDETYDPPEMLALGETYYWRVDCDGNTGDLWSFTTRRYIVLEDFETGIDGWSAGGGGEVNHDVDTVYNGSGSLRFYYSGNSTATDSNLPLSDFTKGKVLSMMLTQGPDGDDPGTDLSVILTDGDSDTAEVTFDETMPADSWLEWNVLLTEFTTANANLDLDDIVSVQLKVTTGINNFYIDDVILYGAHCVPSEATLDLDNDCMVDNYEVGVIAEEWLRTPTDVAGTWDGPVAFGTVSSDPCDPNSPLYDANPLLAGVQDIPDFNDNWADTRLTRDDDLDGVSDWSYYYSIDDGNNVVNFIQDYNSLFWKSPDIKTTPSLEFRGQTDATIVWKMSEPNTSICFRGNVNALSAIHKPARYSFEFILYSQSDNQQGLMMVPLERGIVGAFQIEHPSRAGSATTPLVSQSNMDYDWCTLEISADGTTGQVDWTLTQDGSPVDNGSFDPCSLEGNGTEAWSIQGSGYKYGDVNDANMWPFPNGGSVQSVSVENVPGITEEMDSIDDDLINMRDLAKAGLLWMDEQLWP